MIYSNMNEEELLSLPYADDTSKENIQPQQVQHPTLSLQQEQELNDAVIAFIPSILDAAQEGGGGGGSGSTSIGDGVVQDTTCNDGVDGVGGQVCLESSLPTEERLEEAALERKQWLEKHNKKLEKFRAKKDYFGVSTIKNATKPNVVQAVIGCGLLLYSFKLTSTSALGRQYTITEAALFFDFAKRIIFVLNDLTTPELRLAKAESLLSGAETVTWVDCSAEFVGQIVYDFFQRSRNEGASFNFPFPNKVDELWKKEVAKRGLCVDNEFTLERKQAIFCEVLKCIIKKLKKKIATLAKAVQAANNSEMKANRVVFI